MQKWTFACLTFYSSLSLFFYDVVWSTLKDGRFQGILIQADPDGLQKRETSMFFSRFLCGGGQPSGIKKKKVSNSSTERKKKHQQQRRTFKSRLQSRSSRRRKKTHLQRGRGVDSARPPLTPGHFIKSDIEINYRLGSDFRPITAPVA